MARLLQLFYRAPAALTAATVALGIFALCAVKAVRIIASNAPATPATGIQLPQTHVTHAESMACRRQIARLKAYALPSSAATPPGYLRNLYEWNAVTVANPGARGIPRPLGYSSAVSAYREVWFVGELNIAAVDLNTETATLDFGVLFGNPKPVIFPSGTTLTLNIVASTGGVYAEPLAANVLFAGHSDVAITMPLSGNRTDYPDDSYHLSITYIAIEADLPGQRELTYDIDLPVPTTSADALTATHVMAIPGRRLVFPDQDECASALSLIFDRASSAAFVWLIALLPCVFIMLVAQTLLDIRRRRRQVRARRRAGGRAVSRDGAKLGIEAGVAFLSIFALRNVLVPADVFGLTRVDYLLGAEAALLVLLVAAASVLDTEEGSRSDHAS